MKTNLASKPSDDLPSDWRLVRLGEVSALNPRRPPLERKDEEPTTFVPMPAVDSYHGAISTPETRPYKDVRKGYTYFEDEDVLFAKITPCMENGKSAIAHGLKGGVGFGSTEFHVIRPGPEVLPTWIHLYVRQPRVLDEAKNHFTGAVGQQRVPASFLLDLEIPLPPLPEQRRISSLLKKQFEAVEKARAAVLAQIEDTNDLFSTFLRSIFNSEKAGRWPKVSLGEIADVCGGIALGRKVRNGLPTRPVHYLRVANVKDGYLDLSDVFTVEATDKEIEKLALQSGDLLFTEGGDPDKLGRGTYWENQLELCIHQNHIFRARFDPENFFPPFIAFQTSSDYGKEYFLRHGKRTTGIATINKTVLSAFPVMAPPFSEQKEIAERLSNQKLAVEKLKRAFEEQLAEIVALPSALLRQAFNGAL